MYNEYDNFNPFINNATAEYDYERIGLGAFSSGFGITSGIRPGVLPWLVLPGLLNPYYPNLSPISNSNPNPYDKYLNCTFGDCL